MNAELGRRLRQARLELGLSGTELARRIGKSQPYISDLERGQRTPSLPTLAALAQALDRPLSYFLSADETPEAVAWPERALPTEKANQFTRRLAAAVVDQLLSAELLHADADTDRDKLVQIVHQAIQNAYHHVRPTTLRRRSEAASRS